MINEEEEEEEEEEEGNEEEKEEEVVSFKLPYGSLSASNKDLEPNPEFKPKLKTAPEL